MRYGTAHFEDLAAARVYYATYGFSAEEVARKLKVGEIFLGPPPLKPGQKLHLDRQEHRYFIEEASERGEEMPPS